MIERIDELRVLARTLNFNSAAQELHMSQSTLTRHVAALEAHMGFRIFDRAPMQLTPEGEYFLVAAGKAYDEYRAAIAECQAMARRKSESICVNMVFATHSLRGSLIHEAIAAFHERLPHLATPHFYQMHTMPIEASVTLGLADVGVVFRRPSELPDGFACAPLASYPLAAYFSRTSPMADCETVTFSDLEKLYLVCPSNAQLHTTFEGALDMFRRNGATPRYRVREVDDFDRIGFLLGSDEFVLGNHIPGMIDPGLPLVAKRVVAQDDHYPVYLLYDTRSQKPGVQEFVDLCAEIARVRAE